MFPVVNPVMINTPELVQAGSLARLPWPDGSVVSARLAPTDTPGTALLMLGSYRLLAQVPPSIPMGEVWLMLVNRHMPARFELLTDMQALQLLAGMLEAEQHQTDKAASATRQATGEEAGKPAARAGGDIPDWPHLGTPQGGDGKQLPWAGEASADGNTLLWYDRQDDQPRGMLHRQVGNASFTLSGRVDLESLGGISFNLSGAIPQHPHPEQAADSGGANQAMHLKLHATDRHQSELRQGLADWLAVQRNEFPGISAELCSELPQSGSLTECTG